MKELSKELGYSFKWFKALLKYRSVPKALPKLSRYTNLSMDHIWEKYDFQTQLLLREMMLPALYYNPEVLDPDLDDTLSSRVCITTATTSRSGGGSIGRISGGVSTTALPPDLAATNVSTDAKVAASPASSK
eukprot:Filipodium_phascolosomae@DN5339_c0_g1_i1.p1